MCNDRDEIGFGFGLGHDWDCDLETHDHLSDNKIISRERLCF